MCNSTVPGGISAILANSLLMSIPWIGFFNVKKRMGARIGYISLVFFWLGFEYIHLNWELSWPWLTLGNVFATHPNWVQWYEYTGTSGGSLWVMVVNILLFQLTRQKFNSGRFNGRLAAYSLLVLLLPFVLSLAVPLKYIRTAIARPQNNIVVVQPNVDPWDEKFVAGKEEAQLHQLIQLTESQLDSNTALVVWPETAVPLAVNEDSVKTNYFILPVWDFLKKHPGVNLLTGLEGFRFYDEKHKTRTAQKIQQGDLYADSYNSAVLMDSQDFQVYHKSRLVPGAEALPSFLGFMDSWFEKFGGTTGGYARQQERTVLKTYNNTYKIAPAVCYESVYGEFMASYIRNGANLIVVITNDGWWGNTAGYKQHESYARLRAIETRRWVVRSANTGISCFIDPLGNVIDPQPWNKATAIKLNIPANNEITFFVAHEDLISKAALAITILIVLWSLVLLVKSKLKHG
jgi:apolipoprotein N-acyltransferase